MIAASNEHTGPVPIASTVPFTELDTPLSLIPRNWNRSLTKPTREDG